MNSAGGMSKIVIDNRRVRSRHDIRSCHYAESVVRTLRRPALRTSELEKHLLVALYADLQCKSAQNSGLAPAGLSGLSAQAKKADL
jgi:hypothetical protein